MKPKTADMARGKWRGILMELGVESKFLTGKHGPCPACGGVDRFRWDNKDGSGGFICGQCGSGNGFDLLMLINGWSFPEAAKRVDEIVGNVTAEEIRQRPTEEQCKQWSADLWNGAKVIERADLVDLYLRGRGLSLAAYPKTLRFAPSCRAPDGSSYPAMLAIVHDADRNSLTVHRTFLGRGRKADIAEPRAIMPGALTDGASVRLSPMGRHLGIAEGLETALAAADLFEMPVWATINSSMMARWVPPHGVERVTVFGDNDKKFGGQKAAFTLAHKLACRGILVDVQLPPTLGTDWLDVLNETRAAA